MTKTTPLSWSSLSRQLSTWLTSFTLSSSYLCTTKTIRIWDHPLVYTPQLCCCRVDGNILTFWHCCLLVRLGEHPLDSLDPWTTYGPVVTILIIILRLLSFLALPQVSEMRIICWSWQWYEICWWWKNGSFHNFQHLTFSPRSCSTWWACWPWTRSSQPPPSSQAPSSAPSSVSGWSLVASIQT